MAFSAPLFRPGCVTSGQNLSPGCSKSVPEMSGLSEPQCPSVKWEQSLFHGTVGSSVKLNSMHCAENATSTDKITLSCNKY